MNESEMKKPTAPSTLPKYFEFEKLLHCQQKANKLISKVNEKLFVALLLLGVALSLLGAILFILYMMLVGR